MATANLLQNVSALKTWEAAIPNDNLSAYCGLLNVDMHGQFYEHFKNFKASGSLEFDNKNLAKVHLLGPFMHIFSTKLANFSSIEFNKLQATIDVNNGLIETQKAQLLGPCAQANIQGSINVLTQQLKAKMQFSFFDYDQIKMPIVRHMVQFFQPISQGFSASIQGTFKEPRWKFYFNPFKFLFKKFHKK